MMELQDQADDAKEFVDSVKENYLAEEIYVFTPDGAVRSLPKDSGPIDFAYEIHTKVGEKATGAKVNGRMVPLTTKLKTGDQVEMLPTRTPLGRAVTGSIWSRLARRVTRFVSSLKIKIRNCLSTRVVKC